MGAQHYAYDAATLADGAAASPSFAVAFLRGGAQGGAVVEAGDLVEIHLNLGDRALAQRAPLSITLLPLTGAATQLELRGPDVYGDSTVVMVS